MGMTTDHAEIKRRIRQYFTFCSWGYYYGAGYFAYQKLKRSRGLVPIPKGSV